MSFAAKVDALRSYDGRTQQLGPSAAPAEGARSSPAAETQSAVAESRERPETH